MADCEAGELRIGFEVESAFRRLYEDDFMIRYGIKLRSVRKPSPGRKICSFGFCHFSEPTIVLDPSDPSE